MIILVRGITFLSTLLSIGLFLGLTLTAFLLIKQSRKSYANLFLALVVSCYTIFLLPGYLYGAHLLKSVPHLSSIGSFIFPVLGPLIYFYVKANTRRSFRLRTSDLLHFVPFLIFIVLDWQLLTAPSAEKYADYEILVAEGIFPFPVWERLAKVLVAIIYFALSARLILRYQRHLSATSTSIDRSYAQWLFLFSSSLLVPLVVMTLVALTQYQLISVTIFVLSFVFFITMVYCVALLRPSLFHRFPNRMESESSRQIAQKKYESSTLREAQKEQMVAKLLTCVTHQKPYLEPELTLSQLAEQVDIPAHYLSQIINEKIQQSFGDFINSYRIEKAKNMLTDDQYSHYTIIATAYEAGFNSKTAFYEAFKKFTGTTPSKYRKSLIDSTL